MCACVCVHFHLPCPLSLSVSLCLAHAGNRQQTVVGVADTSSIQRKAAKSTRSSRWLAITGVLSPQLPLYAAMLVRDWRGDTEGMMSCTDGVTRGVIPPELCSKPHFRLALEPCTTGAWFRLAGPFLVAIQKAVLRFLFLVNR